MCGRLTLDPIDDMLGLFWLNVVGIWGLDIFPGGIRCLLLFITGPLFITPAGTLLACLLRLLFMRLLLLLLLITELTPCIEEYVLPSLDMFEGVPEVTGVDIWPGIDV